MLKKMVLTGGALALLSSVTLGVPLFSYARCGVDWLRSSATESMPVEWELKRARQMIADLKLSRPLGSEAAKAKSRRTESWRSGRSLDNITANLRALDALYAGPAGFSTLVTSNRRDAALDAVLRDRMKVALAAAEAIRPPLSVALGDAEERPKVERLLAEVRALEDLATSRLAVALDLPVGFNAFDGD